MVEYTDVHEYEYESIIVLNSMYILTIAGPVSLSGFHGDAHMQFMCIRYAGNTAVGTCRYTMLDCVV